MVDVADAKALAILTRAPSSGGKRRLFTALGQDPDPTLLVALLLDTVENASAPGLTRVVAVTPASGCDEVRRLVPAGVQVIPQEGGSLGERMSGTMRALFDGGAWGVALIGSDLPAITSRLIARAFELLARDPDAVVLGPAADGGYYLIAATRLPAVFDAIEWGSERVLQQTVEAARVASLRVHLLDVVADVDTPDTLYARAASGCAPRTSAWLRAARIRG